MGGEDEGGKLVGGFELSAVLNIAQALLMSESSLEYFGKYQMHPKLVSVCFKCIPNWNAPLHYKAVVPYASRSSHKSIIQNFRKTLYGRVFSSLEKFSLL